LPEASPPGLLVLALRFPAVVVLINHDLPVAMVSSCAALDGLSRLDGTGEPDAVVAV
jgi:hypothetical protein